MSKLKRLSPEEVNDLIAVGEQMRPYLTFTCPQCKVTGCIFKYPAPEIIFCGNCNGYWQFVEETYG